MKKNGKCTSGRIRKTREDHNRKHASHLCHAPTKRRFFSSCSIHPTFRETDHNPFQPMMMKLVGICLSNPHTADSVRQCPLVDEMKHVTTVDTAKTEIRTERYNVLIAGLGVDAQSCLLVKATDTIKNGNNDQKKKYSSPLFGHACKYYPEVIRIVYSYTAHESPKLTSECYKCGADAVVSSPSELEHALRELFSMSSSSSSSSTNPKLGGEQFQNAEHPPDRSNAKRRAVVVQPAVISDLPIVRRRDRESQLKHLAGDMETYRAKKLRRITDQLEQQILDANKHCTIGHSQERLISKQPESKIRVVHISDTHNHHRRLIPSALKHVNGDLFIHTGDIVGNYDSYTILHSHLQDFLLWLEEFIFPRFDFCALVAGNHDVILDTQSNRFDPIALEMLQQFVRRYHNKVVYLDHSSIEYRGFLIYGSPMCCCRRESMGKHYLSHGFERKRKERSAMWHQIPSNVDILLTHVSPDGLYRHVTGSGDAGCEYLTQEMYKNKDRLSRPLLHAFGHVHSGFGIGCYTTPEQEQEQEQQGTELFTNTILSNSSQMDLLHHDPLGVTPMVIDLSK